MSHPGLAKTDKVYFIRHKQYGDNVPKVVDLMNEKRISIVFDNQPWGTVFDEAAGAPSKHYFKSMNKANSAYRSALSYMNKLSTEGGYIVVEYLDCKLPSGKGVGAVVSRVKKGTKVEANKDYPVTLKLDEDFFHEIHYSDYPVLLAIRPPYGTICEPSRATYRNLVEYKLTGNKPGLSPDLLHPKMVEQMCVEYLRETGVNGKKLSYCTLRPGKSLAVIDINGVLDDGNILFAQVKNSKISTGDFIAFENFVMSNNDGENVVFSKDRNMSSQNVNFINVDDVFDHFKNTNVEMLNKMIGF